MTFLVYEKQSDGFIRNFTTVRLSEIRLPGTELNDNEWFDNLWFFRNDTRSNWTSSPALGQPWKSKWGKLQFEPPVFIFSTFLNYELKLENHKNWFAVTKQSNSLKTGWKRCVYWNRLLSLANWSMINFSFKILNFICSECLLKLRLNNLTLWPNGFNVIQLK